MLDLGDELRECGRLMRMQNVGVVSIVVEIDRSNARNRCGIMDSSWINFNRFWTPLALRKHQLARGEVGIFGLADI